MKYYCSWSGGKDSTATIILCHEHNLPLDEIIFSEVIFDKKRDISGELPEHIEFMRNVATPMFESWGYKVTFLRSEKDYMDLFFHVITQSKDETKNGKIRGFLLGGRCGANDQLKIRPMRRYYKQLKMREREYMQYVGIAIDEPERLERLEGTNKISLLAKYNMTEQQAFQICDKYGLLSPIYQYTHRGGCWFCPGQNYASFAHLKTKHPELWNELWRLSKMPNKASECFKYNKHFDELDALIDRYMEKTKYSGDQIKFF